MSQSVDVKDGMQQPAHPSQAFFDGPQFPVNIGRGTMHWKFLNFSEKIKILI
jgi:hypothetical protein